MSCKHGNWAPCDECDQEDAAWQSAFNAGKESLSEEIKDHEKAYELIFKENTRLSRQLAEAVKALSDIKHGMKDNDSEIALSPYTKLSDSELRGIASEALKLIRDIGEGTV